MPLGQKVGILVIGIHRVHSSTTSDELSIMMQSGSKKAAGGVRDVERSRWCYCQLKGRSGLLVCHDRNSGKNVPSVTFLPTKSVLGLTQKLAHK